MDTQTYNCHKLTEIAAYWYTGTRNCTSTNVCTPVQNPQNKHLEAFTKVIVGFLEAVMAFPSFPKAVFSFFSLVTQLSL